MLVNRTLTPSRIFASMKGNRTSNAYLISDSVRLCRDDPKIAALSNLFQGCLRIKFSCAMVTSTEIEFSPTRSRSSSIMISGYHFLLKMRNNRLTFILSQFPEFSTHVRRIITPIWIPTVSQSGRIFAIR